MPTQIPAPHIEDRDWSGLNIGQKIQQLEVEGYLVLPGVLSLSQVAALKRETAKLTTEPVSYSVHQQVAVDIQFVGGAITELIAHPPTIDFLKILFGDEIIMMTYVYARSEPGHPGISLHTDGQPYGSKIFGFEHSCPILIPVLYYLDDLTPDVSPFRVVPRSHLSLHTDGNPYKRYSAHPEEVMVTTKAGDAVLINQRVFHGNYPNVGSRSREFIRIAYRPAWSGPVAEVKNWHPEELARVSEPVRRLMADRNKRQWDFAGGDKPPNMASEAPGINPSRWELR